MSSAGTGMSELVCCECGEDLELCEDQLLKCLKCGKVEQTNSWSPEFSNLSVRAANDRAEGERAAYTENADSAAKPKLKRLKTMPDNVPRTRSLE